MKKPIEVFARLTFALTAALLVPLAILHGDVNAQANTTITVCTDQGSILLVELDEPSFQFGEPRSNGEILFREVRFDELQQLRLTPEPIGGQATRVAQLIADLDHPDYRVREEAERLLSEPKIGGRFEEMIRKSRDTGSMEAQYRINRILQNLVEHVNLEPAKMDRLLLKDGQQFSGDATRLEIRGRVLGKPVRLARDQIRHVFGPGEFKVHRPIESGDRLMAATTVLQPAAPFFENASDTVLDFENDPYGSSIALNDRMNDMFVSQGLRLSSDSPRYVRSIRFSFKLCPLGEGIKAICVHDPETNRTFRGVTYIDFCVPGQPDVAAGVHRFGVFVERVDHSRDFVAEALDQFGNVVGYSEATDQGCWFIGFDSKIPIARVRILQNRYLPDSGRNLDEMYALDNLTYDAPVILEPPPTWVDSPAYVHVESGSIVALQQMVLTDTGATGHSADLQQSVSLGRDQVRAVHFPSRSVAAPKSHWYVMLKDGSTVLCRYQNGFRLALWNDHPVSLDEIVGFWPASGPGRSAPPEDFESGKPVVVFPGCRVLADDLVLAGDVLEWNPDSAHQTQTVILADNEKPSELDDPCPNISLIRMDAPKPAPTVWFHPPLVDPDQPHIVTADGQRWMTGEDGMFTIKAIHDRSIRIQFGNEERNIPFGDLCFGRFK